MAVEVCDPTDPRLSAYRNVPDPEMLQERGIFVAEGRLVVRRLLVDSRFATRSVMVTDAARVALADVLDARPDVPVYVVPPPLMQEITGFNIHRGCLAIGERPPATRWEEVTALQRLVVVLEQVANADNVGAVFRNAAAFGAGAVLVDEGSTDPLYRKAIRTSMGAALLVPFARVASAPEVLDALRSDGFATIAMTPAASASTIRSIADSVGSQPVALALGHEGDGLTPGALEACTHRARIPIAAAVDSLNVAAAAAIALYELGRRVV